jgi:hypothetical protein
MRASRSVLIPADSAPHAELDALRAVRWAQEHEIHSLNETILVYREGASVLASKIAELRHELARLAALNTRKSAYGDQEETEITLAGDDDAPAVVALAVGEALVDRHSEATVEACQVIASELTEDSLLRHGIDQMLLLRIRHSETAIGIEIVPPVPVDSDLEALIRID